MRFLILAAILLTACLESEDPKKVELVDNTTKNDPNAGKQAVNDEDFAALQAEVKALKNELASLKSSKADKVSVTALDNELSAVAASVNGLASSSVKQLWLYDGNGTKRHKVVSVQDREGYKEAIVEIVNGVTARYKLHVFADQSLNQAPGSLDSNSGGIVGLYYSESGCKGTAIIPYIDGGDDFSQAGTFGAYLAYTTKDAEKHTPFASLTVREQNGSCTSLTTSLVGRTATVVSVSTFTYPNPLSVGP